jgi:DNA-binding transcriptional ArsR family regulator
LKRDMDLVRKILLAIEDCPKPYGPQDMLAVEGYADDVISHHIKILSQAGLIEAYNASGIGLFQWYAGALTWDGHEFLEAVEEDTKWNKIKRFVIDKTGSLTFEAIKFAITEGMKSQLSPGP